MHIPFTNSRVHLGWLVAPVAAAVPKRVVIPILQGPAIGIRWVVGSGMPNFWLGTYEREKVELFSRELFPGSVVCDIGANSGIYTVLACRAVGPSGHVFSFEPAPQNLSYLNRNIRVNRYSNCTVIPKAVSNLDGTVSFDPGIDPCVGKISTDGVLRVPCTSLDAYFSEQRPLPQLLKIDVEGAEYEVLDGARCVLSGSRPTIFLATHGENVHARCCKFLGELGYDLQFLASDEVIARFRPDSK
jgi:FkbM family methyltransferase